MGKHVSRRKFIRNSAIGTSVVALGRPGTARGFPAHERVRLGWVGVGGRGSHLFRTMMANCPDAQIVGVAELRPDRLAKGLQIAERDKPKGYKCKKRLDFLKMLEEQKPDGMLAIVAPSDHAGVVVPILERNFNTFSEKPMDTTVERVDRIVKAARKSKGIYQIGTQRRYNPGYVDGMKVIHSGEIGKVTFMQGHWHWPWNTKMRIDTHGGELVEQAVHHTDVATWAAGDVAPHTCVSMAYQQFDDPAGPNVFTETHSATSWMFPGGIIFSYTHLFYLPAFFTSEKFVVFCKEAGIDLATGMMYTRKKERKRVSETSMRPWDNKLRSEVAGLARKLDRGDESAQRPLIDTVTHRAGQKDWGKGTAEELCDFVANIKSGAKRVPNANVETGRVATLMAIMGRTAMRNQKKNTLEPQLLKWKDLGTTTDL